LGYEWGADELVDGVVGFEQGDFLGQTVTRGQPGWCNRPRIHAGYEAERQRERERNTVGERGGEGRREEERGVSEGRGKVTHFEDQLVLGRLRIEPLASFDDPCHL